MLEGRLVKAKGGFYFVRSAEGHTYRCRARGKLKELGIELLIGDWVKIELQGEEGVIEDVLPRKNRLHRPPVANVDQALVLSSVAEPPLDLLLLDRMLVACSASLPALVLSFNKLDLLKEKDRQWCAQLKKAYESCGYTVLPASAKTGQGLEELEACFRNTTTVLAGPSGVGKTTLLNRLDPSLQLDAAPVSKKSKRGRHTTRHVELISLDEVSYVVDTPGFQRLELRGISSRELDELFPELRIRSSECRFQDCFHAAEPDCAVREAAEKGEIPHWRYRHYMVLLRELQQKEKRY